MDHLLAEVSREEHENGRGLLSVIVVHKYGDKEPGNGFYDLADQLGFDVSNPEAFWISEFTKVTEYWKTRRTTPLVASHDLDIAAIQLHAVTGSF